MMYLISEERLKEFADIMRRKTGETEERSLEDIKNKLDAVRTENDFLVERECKSLFEAIANELTTVSKLDTRNVTNMDRMFNTCASLTEIPKMDTSSVTSMASMFASCRGLTTIPKLDTSYVTNMYGMFDGCSNLITIPQLDTSSVINMSNMFSR